MKNKNNKRLKDEIVNSKASIEVRDFLVDILEQELAGELSYGYKEEYKENIHKSINK